MKKLRIKNWDKYQHYKDRNPTWFKLHKSMITSRDWVMLDNDGRALMIALMMMACQFEDALIPYDEEYVCRVAYFEKVDFKPLINLGFLEVVSNDTEPYQTVPNGTWYVSDSVSDSVSKKEIVKEKVSRETLPKEFLEFWDKFPKQRAGSQVKAHRAWLESIRRGAGCDEIISGCLTYAQSEEVHRGFAKGCAAWLNDDRWKNDYTIKTGARNEQRGSNKSIHQPSEAATAARRRGIANALARRVEATGRSADEISESDSGADSFGGSSITTLHRPAGSGVSGEIPITFRDTG